jgi:hypothetical protein
LATALVLLASLQHDETAAQGPGSAAGQPVPVAKPSGILPVVVEIPSSVKSAEDARPFFDDFSWRSLIALNWPADPARRGVPKSPGVPGVFLKAGPSYPAVWGSYREAYELFRLDGGRPPPFAAKEQWLPFCGGVPAGTKVLLMGTKSGTLLQATSQSFSYPLVDQNLNYVYFEIRFNRDQYEFVRGGDKSPPSWLYLASNLAAAESKAPISMPISAPQPYQQGAVMLKAAWKQLAAHDPRYYTVPAVIYDPSSKTPCVKTQVGLIGFHIGHKVKDFPQWIWSSFEHVDNVPNDDGSNPPGPMTLNNGKKEPATVGGWADRPASQNLVPKDHRVAAQVTRLNPIPTTPTGRSTVDINAAYRKALAGTVWANYQLVITQWPTGATQFQPKGPGVSYPTGSASPFPVDNAVNTAMETFFQSQGDAAGAGGNSCMRCHYNAGVADYSWSLLLRSH